MRGLNQARAASGTTIAEQSTLYRRARGGRANRVSARFYEARNALEWVPSRLLGKLEIVHIRSKPPPEAGAYRNDDDALSAQRRKT